MSDLITNIESAIETYIKSMTKLGGYNYNWLSVNINDENDAKTYPIANIEVIECEQLETVESGFGNNAYHQKLTVEISVYNIINEPASKHLYKINEALNLAIEDLLEVFGKNPSLCISGIAQAENILYKGFRKEVDNTGLSQSPKYIITVWEVYFSQSKTKPRNAAK